MYNIQKLEISLLRYNRKLVKIYRGKHQPPATSIGGIYSNYKHIAHSKELKSPIAHKLRSLLLTLGQVGSHSVHCNNAIGSCCEVHVANGLILKHPTQNNLNIKSITFTKARRPRTNQYIKRCANCLYIFGNEK
jgi:hypothetical protein